jgi:hypothetical protein
MTMPSSLICEPLLTSDPISRHVEFRHGLLELFSNSKALEHFQRTCWL